MNAALGFLLVILAGGLNSSFTLPMKRTSHWAWENTWLVYSIVGMVVVNWAIALHTVPELITVYTRAGLAPVAMTFLFGCVWGISNVLFGLSVDLIGISLSFSICLGISTALGSLIPMTRHPSVFLTPGGMSIAIGVAVTLAGVGVCTLAGIWKDAQAARNAAPTNPIGETASHRRQIRGLILVTLSGLFAPGINYAFVFGDRIKQEAAVQGVSKGAEGDVIWGLALLGSCCVTAAYCVRLLRRNSTWSRYWRKGTFGHWWLAALMGLIWMLSITLYGRGAAIMGPLGGSIGWAVFLGCIIISSNLWGVVSGEWRGGEGRPLRTMFSGLGVLLVAVAILGYANSLPNAIPE